MGIYAHIQQVASILTYPWVDTSSANQTMPSSEIAHMHHAMWVTFGETCCKKETKEKRYLQREGQRRPCSRAKRVAAVRELTPSLW
jgi:hypothetical protein